MMGDCCHPIDLTAESQPLQPILSSLPPLESEPLHPSSPPSASSTTEVATCTLLQTPSIAPVGKKRARECPSATVTYPSIAAAAAAAPTRSYARFQEEERRYTIMRLYSHALQSIFVFLPFRDLSSIIRVSKSWNRALHSVKYPVKVIVTSRQLRSIFNGTSGSPTEVRLSQHITGYQDGSYYSAMEVTPRNICVISSVIPNLRQLSVYIRTPRLEADNFRLSFPKHLIHLDVNVRITNETHYLIEYASELLPFLTTFRLRLRIGDPKLDYYFSEICFFALHSAPSLTEFYLQTPPEHPNQNELEQMSLRQINDLRSAPQLCFVPCSINQNPMLARRLLQEPHDGWTALSYVERSGNLKRTDADLLLKLPNLKQFRFQLVQDIASNYVFDDAVFLLKLVNLTYVSIGMINERSTAPIKNLLASLQHLHKLTRLSISGSKYLSSDDLTNLLQMQQLPHLVVLSLTDCGQLQSLKFLAVLPPLILTHLFIYNGRSELADATQPQYLDGLSQLKKFKFQVMCWSKWDATAWKPMQERLRGSFRLSNPPMPIMLPTQPFRPPPTIESEEDIADEEEKDESHNKSIVQQISEEDVTVTSSATLPIVVVAAAVNEESKQPPITLFRSSTAATNNRDWSWSNVSEVQVEVPSPTIPIIVAAVVAAAVSAQITTTIATSSATPDCSSSPLDCSSTNGPPTKRVRFSEMLEEVTMIPHRLDIPVLDTPALEVSRPSTFFDRAPLMDEEEEEEAEEKTATPPLTHIPSDEPMDPTVD